MQDTAIKEVAIVDSKNWELLLLIFSAISSACILVWLMKYSHYGIDFTDESFYVVSLSNPFIYDWSISQFGYIYHPLYQVLGGDIVALRQANIFITFSLAWLLTSTLLKVIAPEGPSKHWQRLIISAGFATASLVFLATWLPTPSYNSLSLQALLIAATGLLMVEATPSSSSTLGWILLGLGGWFAFMAKPSTAAALAVCACVYLLFSGKINIRLLLISGGVAIVLLILSALAIDGSLFKFMDRLSAGVAFASILGGGHTFIQIMRLDDFQLSEMEINIILYSIIILFIAARFSYSGRTSIKFVGLMLSAVFFLVVLIITIGIENKNITLDKFQGLLLSVIPFSAAALWIASCRRNFFSITISQWVLALAFVVFPHVYAFGSNGNYWYTGSFAGVFWLLAGLVLVGPIARNENKWIVFLPLALATQVIVVLLIQTGLETPYRQTQALRLNNHAIQIGKPGSLLILSEGYFNYVSEATFSAKRVGLEVGTPVIDLSGQSPGILYALQAENIGQAWTIGGYPGSLKLATAALKRVPCEKISTAWILAEPSGPRSIPAELLASFGANLAEHYEQVATWRTAKGVGGYQEQRLQMLLKPIRAKDIAVQACNANTAGQRN